MKFGKSIAVGELLKYDVFTSSVVGIVGNATRYDTKSKEVNEG